MKRIPSLFCALLISLASASAPVAAQTSAGEITGVVSDPSGAVVPNAAVELLGAQTGDVVRKLQTNGEGGFSAPLLRPGQYSVAVSAAGFKRLLRSNIDLRVDDVLTLHLTLEPGAASESITVSASTEMLEEKTNSVGQVIDTKTIEDLPLNGRNYLQLGALTAGAVPSDRSRDKSFSAYGNRGLQNAFLLDGARNQNYLRGLDNRARDAMRPSLEAIAEFKVQTSNFSAEYGASAGAVVNVVTKSGTNAVHGSAFEFLRNSAFDARDFFLPSSRLKPLFIEHQFGGSLGGPIVRNRAWWFGAFQRTHISEEETNTATVPLPQQRNGIFGNIPIYDPLTTRANPNGSGFIRDQFPNNTIPVSRFDPVGKALVERYPDPQIPGIARNYVGDPLQSTRGNNGTFRGDFRITDRDTLFGRYSFDDDDFLRRPILPEPAQTGTNRTQPSRSLGFGYTRVISPTVVNEVRFAWNRVGVDQNGTLKLDPIVAGSLASGVNSSIPTFGLTGYATIGDQPPGFGNVPLIKSSGVWNFSDNVSVSRGKQTIKAGFDYQVLRISTFATLNGRGSFGFTGVFSQNPQGRPNTGSPIADLLLGLPNAVTLGSPTDSAERTQNYYGYVQDDWTISPSFTLNLGLRYELTRPFTEAHDKLASFILDGGDPLFGQLIVAGDSRRPKSLLDTAMNNWAPRIGFAWKPPLTGTVIRAGYGIFYGQDEGFGVSQRLTNNPPFVGIGGATITSDQLRASSTVQLSAGLPPRPSAPDAKSFKLDPSATSTLISWPERYTLPYIQQWNLSVQKELPGATLLEVNYVGSRGTHLWGAYQANEPLPGPGSVNDRRPYAQFSRAPINRIAPWVKSTYQGTSTRLEKRFSKGVGFLAAFTFGRSLDTQSNIDLCDGCTNSSGAGNVQDVRNLNSNYGLSDQHIGKRFVLSGTYELPFGKGKAYLAHGPGRWVLGDWQLSGVYSASDGLPYTLNLAFDNANTGTVNWPNRIASGSVDHPTVNRWFDLNAFTFPPQYTFGNAGRNILIGPGVNNVD
ncbi:MAG: carboxypeptidase regulatory-like domain-containing protein, partial [Acidobacteriota bacterium]|nr:carboxypeptidase regulatory-like domain-containing protein [Acidobacteriota bacterium]